MCDGDVPYLVYDVAVTGTPNETVTITWLNPTGDDVVQAGLPLSGRVLWPGATVNAAGEPTGWPGWVFEDGEWVEGGDFGWVRPSVEVLFQVNPEMTVSVDYPPSSPNCSTNPPARRRPPAATSRRSRTSLTPPAPKAVSRRPVPPSAPSSVSGQRSCWSAVAWSWSPAAAARATPDTPCTTHDEGPR